MSNDSSIRVRRPAMGCEFEMVLCGKSRDYLIAAAEEAFEEIRRLEEQLSVFVPTSEVSWINSMAASEPVRVEPRLYRLLVTAVQLSRDTDGAFDITAGRLVELWDSVEGAIPSDDEISAALNMTGASNVLLDDEACTVRFARQGVMLNLGAIGKGYAAAEVVQYLRDLEISSALIAAGASTIHALGSPPDDDAWTVGILNPLDRGQRIASVRLTDQAMSTSGSHERFVEIDGVHYSHIIDPRNGRPADGPLLACAIAPSPTESDALSTAFFIQGVEWARRYCEARDDVGAIVVTQEPSGGSPVVHKIRIFR